MARQAAKRAQRHRARRPTPSRRSEETKALSAAGMRILNCIPSRDMEKDWGFDNALAAGIVAAAPIPQSKDLREKWWVVNDQGSTGSCVGWATADSVLRWHFVKVGRLKPAELLSPRFIWMAAKEFDEFTTQPTTFIETDGTSLKAALDIARRYGCVRDSILPFGSGKLFPGESNTFYAIAAELKITSYINLGRDLAAWRHWIATKGPILTRLNCDNTWMNAKLTGGKLDAYDPLSVQGGHAVALVGYDSNLFIVRNSWGGIHWGDKGFGYASNAYAAAAFTEAYGVNVI
jgi:Papain family cysteine protease